MFVLLEKRGRCFCWLSFPVIRRSSAGCCDGLILMNFQESLRSWPSPLPDFDLKGLIMSSTMIWVWNSFICSGTLDPQQLVVLLREDCGRLAEKNGWIQTLKYYLPLELTVSVTKIRVASSTCSRCCEFHAFSVMMDWYDKPKLILVLVVSSVRYFITPERKLTENQH